jgi:hypothetical protein
MNTKSLTYAMKMNSIDIEEKDGKIVLNILFVCHRYNKLGGGPITSVSFSYEQMDTDQ